MKASQIKPLALSAGVLVALALTISNTGRPAAVTLIPIKAHRHAPNRLHQQHDNGPSESDNWSGYAVTGSNGAATDVKGSWTVPAVNCSSTGTGTPTAYAAFWVGIDGYNSDTVEQIGTDSDCVSLTGRSGIPTYYAWVEFYPHASALIQFPHGIQPSNQITAEVKYIGQSSGGPHQQSGAQFTATITVNENETYTVTSTVPEAKESSAEWIAEAPCCSRGNNVLPLANFGTVPFSSASATVGATLPVGSFPTAAIQEITMVSETKSSITKAQPSQVTNESAFSVQWLNPGP